MSLIIFIFYSPGEAFILVICHTTMVIFRFISGFNYKIFFEFELYRHFYVLLL